MTVQLITMAQINLLSYNMRGFNSGYTVLHDLCLKPSIIALQETWLHDSESDNLSLINNNYNYHAVSGMNSAAANRVIKGRPFGVVGFLWQKSFNAMIQYVAHDVDSRCLVMKLQFNNYVFLLCNVYFPCYKDCPEYKAKIASLTGFIENVLLCNTYDNVIILDDTNFDLKLYNTGFNIFNSLINDADMSACDNLVQGPIFNTYFNEALGCESRIDHFFVSRSLKAYINQVSVIDSSCNYSDHRPITMVITMPLTQQLKSAAECRPNNSSKQFKVRWDRACLNEYYNCTRELLYDMVYDNSHLQCNTDNCSCVFHKQCIDLHYAAIVNTLTCAQYSTIPCIPCNALKPFWNEYLDEMRDKSIFWHSMWISAGRPSTGWLGKIKTSSRLKYKFAIREALREYENRYNDELYEHFANKDTPSFWKSWSKKMNCNINKDVYINGVNDNLKVANEFATYFETVYSDSSLAFSAVDEFRSLYAQSVNPTPNKPTCSPQQITVQLIDQCIRKLKLGKANGHDGLSAENLVNAHPLLVVNLSLLFRSMAYHGYVPHNFGQGTIVPLLKDKLGDVNDVNNYRGITLIPVISKLFELVIVEICHF